MAAQLTLTWAAADGATEYAIERELLTLGTFAEVGRVAAGTTSYVDTSVLAAITYCYRLRAVSGTVYSDYSNVACGAPAGGGGTFFDDFNRPDATALGNGWTAVAGTLAISSAQARNGPVRSMHTAIQPGLSGAGQAVSASFTSVDNNVGPRFALLVRYKDPRNYYACYRQSGGTSVLRISRVVNGVETVLKSYALANPYRGVPFTLGCQVQGTTLSLTLGAIKISASDLMFASGAVGLSMGYPVAGTGTMPSHVADDFRASVQ